LGSALVATAGPEIEAVEVEANAEPQAEAQAEAQA